MALIQITAYVRDEKDLAIWKQLDNKTEFLHHALNNTKPELVPPGLSKKELSKLAKPVITYEDDFDNIVLAKEDIDAPELDPFFNPKDYIYSELDQAMFDRESGEKVELTADQVKQVKGI